MRLLTAKPRSQIIFYAITTANITMIGCTPSPLGGYANPTAWQKGVCVTEEMVWCRAHPNEHPDCATAACRAEEVRLSLEAIGENGWKGFDGVSVYGCPFVDQLQAWSDGLSSNGDRNDRRIACVPAGDKRSFHLPQCDVSSAAERSEFYVARRLNDVRKPSLTWTHHSYNATERCTASCTTASTGDSVTCCGRR